jgi:DnaJ-class molecular chaperone
VTPNNAEVSAALEAAVKPVACRTCHGEGTIIAVQRASGRQDCPVCGGVGKLPNTPDEIAEARIVAIAALLPSTKCGACGGFGQVEGPTRPAPCRACRGGKIPRDPESITNRELVALQMDAPWTVAGIAGGSADCKWRERLTAELRGRMGRGYVREVSDLEASIEAERNAPSGRNEPDGSEYE